MKKLLLMTYRFMALTLVLCIYNINVFAADLDISSLIERIPITSEVPSLIEILKPLPGLYRLNCNKTFPQPELFFSEKTEVTVGGVEYIKYFVSINNKEDYPDYLFNESPGLPPCGLNDSASRTWVSFYDEVDDYIYGFCALPSSDHFDGLWFAHKKTEPQPSQVSVVLKDRLCNKEYKSAAIALEEITIASDAPVIAGIGLVPRTLINQSNGLATTGSEHPYKNALDAPFGKSLRFIGNIDRLRSLGVDRYAVAYCDMGLYDCDALFTTGFNVDEWTFIEDVKSNYFWSTLTSKYVLHRESPTEIYNDGVHIYKTYWVPSSGIAWYFENLLFDWITQGSVKVPSGLYKVHLFGLSGPDVPEDLVNIPPDESTMMVRIDNTPPVMTINSISYNGVPVSSCSIVTLANATDSIEFNITATDPDGYLLNYVLKGEYGDNEHLPCIAEDYAAYLADGNSGPGWPGASPSSTYSCDGFPKTCAYSYHISGWDRAINGYHRIHYVDYFKTLTIQVPTSLNPIEIFDGLKDEIDINLLLPR